MNLKIECPACDRHFQVHEDLSGKMVECGACDHRFKVDDSRVIRDKEKFYPGEYHDALLDRVGRTPVARDAGVSFQTANYNQGGEGFSPASPAQKVALLAGAVLILGFTALFFLGTTNVNGMFSEVPKMQRYLLGAFVLLLGGGLITWGARNWRDRGVLLFLILAGILLTLITVREVKALPGTREEGFGPVVPEAAPPAAEEDSALVSRLHLKPLEEAIERARAANISQPERSVIGLYVHGMSDSREHSVTQYLSRNLETVSEAPALPLPRNETDTLVIVEGLMMDDDALFSAVKRLGKVTEHPQLRLMEIVLDPKIFEEPGAENFEKLTDYKNPAFYNRNLLELDQVNFERVKTAIDRLSNLPPDAELRYTPEITTKLVEILGQETDGEVRENLALGLRRWNSQDPAVVRRAGKIAENLVASETAVPPALVEYLTAAGYEAVGELIDSMWRKEPVRWQDEYRALGPAAEPRLLTHLRSDSPELQKEAIKVLHSVGGAASLKALAPFGNAQDPEVQILANNAAKAIRTRL